MIQERFSNVSLLNIKKGLKVLLLIHILQLKNCSNIVTYT